MAESVELVMIVAVDLVGHDGMGGHDESFAYRPLADILPTVKFGFYSLSLWRSCFQLCSL